jgi:hypothetical protein
MRAEVMSMRSDDGDDIELTRWIASRAEASPSPAFVEQLERRLRDEPIDRRTRSAVVDAFDLAADDGNGARSRGRWIGPALAAAAAVVLAAVLARSLTREPNEQVVAPTPSAAIVLEWQATDLASTDGPGRVVERGRGTVRSTGAGAVFSIGGQQNSDTSFVQFDSATLAGGFPASGRVEVSLVSELDLNDRTSPEGREQFAYVGAATGPTASDAALSMMIVTDEVPYLSVRVGGALLIVPFDEIETAWRPGNTVTVAAEWTPTSLQVWINGTQSTADATGMPGVVALDAAGFVTIGAAAELGGGYFSSAADALTSVTFERQQP